MTAEILLRYLHFISIFTIVGTLAIEYVLLKPTLTRKEIAYLAKIDGLYGLAAITLLGAGFTLWFGVGKPAAFYSDNPVFWAKIGLFVIVGILSIAPTLFFNKHRKGEATDIIEVPKSLKRNVSLELILLLIIPILAGIMAKGIGLLQ